MLVRIVTLVIVSIICLIMPPSRAVHAIIFGHFLVSGESGPTRQNAAEYFRAVSNIFAGLPDIENDYLGSAEGRLKSAASALPGISYNFTVFAEQRKKGQGEQEVDYKKLSEQEGILLTQYVAPGFNITAKGGQITKYKGVEVPKYDSSLIVALAVATDALRIEINNFLEKGNLEDRDPVSAIRRTVDRLNTFEVLVSKVLA